jgi:hypothetical protein
LSNHWRRDEPQFFNVYGLDPDTERILPPIAAGTEGRLISSDGESGASMCLLRLPAGWSYRTKPDDPTVEILVLEGTMNAESHELKPGGFVAVPDGLGGCELGSRSGGQVMVLWEPDVSGSYYYGSDLHVTRVRDIPWAHTELTGVQHGILHKSLRVPDPAEGALHGGPAGLLRFVLLAPGFGEQRQEVHPEWEAIVFLSGDFLMPERGFCGPGTCLANPAGLWHGPLLSQRGSVMIVQTSGPVGSEFTEVPAGKEISEHYLDGSLIEPPRSEDWPERPEYDMWREIRERD